MLRKSLAVLLALMTALSVLTAASTVFASAAEADLASSGAEMEITHAGATMDEAPVGYSLLSEGQFATKLQELRAMYPHGSAPDYTYYEGGRALAWTCMGYANKMAYYCFGSSQYTYNGGWERIYDSTTLNAGDMVRIDGNSHSIFLTYVSDTRVKFTDGNWGGLVRWEVEMSLSELRSRFSYKWHLKGNNLTGTGLSMVSDAWIKTASPDAPVGAPLGFTFGAVDANTYTLKVMRGDVEVLNTASTSGKTYSFDTPGEYTATVTCGNRIGSITSDPVSFTVYEPATLGGSFTANLINSSTGLCAAVNESGNALLETANDSENQLWLFELTDNNSYKITNLALDKCLDIKAGKLDNGTNIQVYQSNDSDAQRWYLKKGKSGYLLVPRKNVGAALDPGSSKPTSGSNLQEWEQNGSAYQFFTISPVDMQPAEVFENNGHTYAYYDQPTTWNEAYRICERLGGHLATASDERENSLFARMTHGYVWLGVTDFNKTGKWYAINSETLNYTNWETGMPEAAAAGDHYVGFYNTDTLEGQWTAFNEDEVCGFICEYEDELDPDHYIPAHTEIIDAQKYEIYDVRVDWQTAARICEKKGGHLLLIGDKAENDSVTALLKNGAETAYWIGVSDIAHEGSWQTVQGNALTYANWNSGEPNNYAMMEDYVQIVRATGKWNDFKSYGYAYSGIGFICEYDNVELDIPMITTVTVTNTGLNILWDKVAGVSKYRVFYKTNGSWVRIGDTASNTIAFNNAPDGVELHLTVRGLSSKGAYITDCDRPGTLAIYVSPPKFTLSSTAAGMKISWSKRNQQGDMFRLYKRIGNGWSLLSETEDTSYIDPNVNALTTYTYTLKYVHYGDFNLTSGHSPKSLKFSCATPQITGFANTNGAVTVSWNRIAGAAKYRVFYKEGNGWTKIGDTSGLSIVHRNPTVGKQYIYTVRCLSADGKQYTSGYNAAGVKNTLLKNPTVTCTVNPDDITVQWSKVSGAAKYRVFIRPDGQGWIAVADVTGTSYRYAAENGTHANFTVRCLDKNGNYLSGCTPSAHIDFYIAPHITKVTYPSEYRIKLKWSKTEGVTKYRVFIRENNGWKKLADVSTNSYTLTVSDPQNSHRFAIRCLSDDAKSYLSIFRNEIVDPYPAVIEPEVEVADPE